MSEGTSLRQDDASVVVRTYRYLRLAMVGLVILLFSALIIERLATDPRCWQTSISAYWYTPARGVFVGVLVTMGVSLIVLKGNQKSEDVFLNLAGILAPGVAFIPTADAGTCSSMGIVAADHSAAVANNMQALFVVGIVAVVVALVMAVKAKGSLGSLPTWDRIGLVIGFGATVGGAAWFYVARDSFLSHGHNVAAITMFVAIIIVVWLNARDVKAEVEQDRSGDKARYVRMYRTIAILMAVAIGAAIALALTGYPHVVIWIEVVLITLFGAFWVIQTKELWHQGLRHSG